MARVKKPLTTLESLFFSTPEQRVIRFLLSEPTTAFTPRVIASRLKGVRGLGGAEGIETILEGLEEVSLVDFVDNRRAVRVRDDSAVVQMLKAFTAVCDLEGMRGVLEPISTRGILFGSRATGKARSDSDYDLLVVTESPEEVKKTIERHPLGRKISVAAFTPDAFGEIERQNPTLAQKLTHGIVIWGTSW